MAEAVEAYRDVLANREERHFSSVDSGLTGFKAHQNLAAVLSDMGDLVRAEEEWRQVTRLMPRYRAGWRGLAEVLMRAGRHEAARTVAERCLGDPAICVEGYLIRGRHAAAKGDPAAALPEIEARDRSGSDGQCGPGGTMPVPL